MRRTRGQKRFLQSVQWQLIGMS